MQWYIANMFINIFINYFVFTINLLLVSSQRIYYRWLGVGSDIQIRGALLVYQFLWNSQSYLKGTKVFNVSTLSPFWTFQRQGLRLLKTLEDTTLRFWIQSYWSNAANYDLQNKVQRYWKYAGEAMLELWFAWCCWQVRLWRTNKKGLPNQKGRNGKS